MKALVLAGGFPQIDLINKLHNRGIKVVLADYYSHPVARDYADKFYRISTLDIDAIRCVAIDEQVNFVITVCTDQALITMAKISEELKLPCYIDFNTARNVTNKKYMKQKLSESGILTARYSIVSSTKEIEGSTWKYPLIIKPVDCNSSKAVQGADNKEKLMKSVKKALQVSRSGTAIIEEYIDGKELSVDAFILDGEAIILDITTSEKLRFRDRFIIFRTWHPAVVTEQIREEIRVIARQIAKSFGIKDAPMLIQVLLDGEDVYVIEFSARTGGGVKHLSIERRTGVDVISAVISLTLGEKPRIELRVPDTKYMIDEYIYCKPGIYDHMDGFEELKKAGIITDYYEFHRRGTLFESIENSGDRVAGFTIQGDTIEELRDKHNDVNDVAKVLSDKGDDMMRHDLLTEFDGREA